MIDVQAHRGPDGEGLWSTSIGATGVTLGQKRLAIQDLSSADAQPMLSECGGYALNYNGELYHAVELRRFGSRCLGGHGARRCGNVDRPWSLRWRTLQPVFPPGLRFINLKLVA